MPRRRRRRDDAPASCPPLSDLPSDVIVAIACACVDDASLGRLARSCRRVRDALAPKRRGRLDARFHASVRIAADVNPSSRFDPLWFGPSGPTVFIAIDDQPHLAVVPRITRGRVITMLSPTVGIRLSPTCIEPITWVLYVRSPVARAALAEARRRHEPNALEAVMAALPDLPWSAVQPLFAMISQHTVTTGMVGIRMYGRASAMRFAFEAACRATLRHALMRVPLQLREATLRKLNTRVEAGSWVNNLYPYISSSFKRIVLNAALAASSSSTALLP